MVPHEGWAPPRRGGFGGRGNDKEVTVSLTDPRAEMAKVKLAEMVLDGHVKQAADTLTDYTRNQLREKGFLRKIIPPLPISNDQLDRHLYDEKPIYIAEMQPDSPGAVSVPFGTLPRTFYLRYTRYPVHFQRIATPRATKDVDELRTHRLDLRQITSDQMIRDMLAEEDGKFMTAVNGTLIARDAVLPFSEAAQWIALYGGITRETLEEAKKLLPGLVSRLAPATTLVNSLFIYDIQKFGRDEAGGDFSQDLLKKGFSEEEFAEMRWIATIKHDLVPNNRQYFFAGPEFIGKFLVLEDVVMHIKHEAFMVEFMAYCCSGCTIGNATGIGAVDYLG